VEGLGDKDPRITSPTGSRHRVITWGCGGGDSPRSGLDSWMAKALGSSPGLHEISVIQPEMAVDQGFPVL
jgi:hypothetical protein